MNITTDSIESNDGVRIHYVDAGRGEPLLLLPGFAAGHAQLRAAAGDTYQQQKRSAVAS